MDGLFVFSFFLIFHISPVYFSVIYPGVSGIDVMFSSLNIPMLIFAYLRAASGKDIVWLFVEIELIKYLY